MESSNTKKIVIWGVILVLVLFSVYFVWLRPAPQKATVDEFGNLIESQTVGQDLVSLLAELQAVKLDTNLFDSPAFVGLTDFTTDLGKEPQGRNNPFQSFPGVR